MKSFAQFLTENKKQYAFRVKLACDCSKDQLAEMRTALDRFKVSAMSEPKETPIAETHIGFEHLKNVRITIVDVLTDYPANPVQIRETIRDALDISEALIMVTTPGQEANALPVVPVNSDKALLDTEELSPADPKAHELVGLARLEAMLKELDKEKHGGIQYKGVNDEILAKAPHAEKAAQTTNDLPAGNNSMMGNRTMPKMKVR